MDDRSLRRLRRDPGVIVEAVRDVAVPRRCTALVTCASDAQAVALTAALRQEAARAWRGEGPLDVAAVEYMDARSLALVPDEAFQRARISRPPSGAVLVLVQMEVESGLNEALELFGDRSPRWALRTTQRSRCLTTTRVPSGCSSCASGAVEREQPCRDDEGARACRHPEDGRRHDRAVQPARGLDRALSASFRRARPRLRDLGPRLRRQPASKRRPARVAGRGRRARGHSRDGP